MPPQAKLVFFNVTHPLTIYVFSLLFSWFLSPSVTIDGWVEQANLIQWEPGCSSEHTDLDNGGKPLSVDLWKTYACLLGNVHIKTGLNILWPKQWLPSWPVSQHPGSCCSAELLASQRPPTVGWNTTFRLNLAWAVLRQVAWRQLVMGKTPLWHSPNHQSLQSCIAWSNPLSPVPRTHYYWTPECKPTIHPWRRRFFECWWMEIPNDLLHVPWTALHPWCVQVPMGGPVCMNAPPQCSGLLFTHGCRKCPLEVLCVQVPPCALDCSSLLAAAGVYECPWGVRCIQMPPSCALDCSSPLAAAGVYECPWGVLYVFVYVQVPPLCPGLLFTLDCCRCAWVPLGDPVCMSAAGGPCVYECPWGSLFVWVPLGDLVCMSAPLVLFTLGCCRCLNWWMMTLLWDPHYSTPVMPAIVWIPHISLYHPIPLSLTCLHTSAPCPALRLHKCPDIDCYLH